jgi:hypothetical protein
MLLPAAGTAAADAASAPPGRAYELVSPTDMNGGYVYNEPTSAYGHGGMVVASPDGDSVLYTSFHAFAGAEGAGQIGIMNYTAERGEERWTTRPLQPPLLSRPKPANGSGRVIGVTPDLRETILATTQPLLPGMELLADDNGADYLVRRRPDGSFASVGSVPAPGTSANTGFAAISDDGDHVFFTSTAELIPATAGSLYEWTGDALRVASVLPGGAAAAAKAAGGYRFPEGPRYRTVSRDGSRVFFTSSAAGKQELYVRVDGSRTVVVSATRRTPADPNATNATARRFYGASADGRVVWFSSREALTDDANTGAADNTETLYKADLDAGTLVDVARGDDLATGADVLGVLGISDDGSTAYFVASGTIGGQGTAGQPNIYVRRGDTTRLVATVDPADSILWAEGQLGPMRPVKVSADDGSRLVFMSVRSLTGKPAYPGSRGQVYTFDADAPPADALACVSCNPGGGLPSGPSSIAAYDPGTYQVPSGVMPRNVTDDGRRVFFDSVDSLVPEAVANGKSKVYMWEEGRVSLISPGDSTVNARFGDASANGDDVFFTTSQPLLPMGQGETVALWDARVGGGQPLPPVETECEGDACQGPQTPQVVPTDPATFVYTGPGNEEPGPLPPTAVTFSVGKVSVAAQRRFARSGRLTLAVKVSDAGTVRVVGAARLPGRKKAATVVRASASASRAGTVRITLRLSAVARKALARGRGIVVRLAVTHSKAKGARSAVLRLPTAKSPSSTRGR